MFGQIHIQRDKRNERGQSLVETALVLPLVLLLMLAMVDIGLGFRTYMALNNGARETVRWITTNPSAAGVTRGIERGLFEAQNIGIDSGDVTLTLAPAQTSYGAGQQVTATIEHEYELMFGLFTNIPTLSIRTQATMVVLYDE